MNHFLTAIIVSGRVNCPGQNINNGNDDCYSDDCHSNDFVGDSGVPARYFAFVVHGVSILFLELNVERGQQRLAVYRFLKNTV